MTQNPFDEMRVFTEEMVPQLKELGVKLLDVSHNGMRIRVPFQDHFVFDPDSGIVHGGLITIMLDSVCGFSVFLKTKEVAPIATVDYRIDYLQSSVPNRDFIADATCYAVTRNIAFSRGTVYQDGGEPIAHVVATFMRGTAGPSNYEQALRAAKEQAS